MYLRLMHLNLNLERSSTGRSRKQTEFPSANGNSRAFFEHSHEGDKNESERS